MSPYALIPTQFIFALMGTNYSNLNKILGMDGQGLLATYSAQAITGGYFAVRHTPHSAWPLYPRPRPWGP
jgi:hypothetical protein